MTVFTEEQLEQAAKNLFDQRPHNHPDGHAPQWSEQPDHIKEAFRKEARTLYAILR